MLQPVVRRTWAPRGQTPTHYSWDRRDRLSVVSAITVSPQRRHLGLYFEIFGHNIVAENFEGFVAELLVHFPKGIIVVLDRWSVHRSAATGLLRRFRNRLGIEWLPAYAPELNPDEYVWQHTKYADLANYIPANVDALEHKVYQSLKNCKSCQALLHSFFQHAKLKL